MGTRSTTEKYKENGKRECGWVGLTQKKNPVCLCFASVHYGSHQNTHSGCSILPPFSRVLLPTKQLPDRMSVVALENALEFGALWLVTSLGIFLLLVGLFCGSVFVYFYHQTSYEKWLRKSNKNFPSVEAVRTEILGSIGACMVFSVYFLLPLYLPLKGYRIAGYFDLRNGVWHEVKVIMLLTVALDYLHWLFHHLQHTWARWYNSHKYHHRFFNPTPFSAFADNWDDVIFLSAQTLTPLFIPQNVFIAHASQFLFFATYSIYLHAGFCDHPHQKVFNTGYFHFLHHKKSVGKDHFHSGYFLQLWDRLAGTCVDYEERCECPECDAKAGNRTREHYEAIVKPDYSRLFDMRFTFEPGAVLKEVFGVTYGDFLWFPLSSSCDAKSS